MSIKNLSDHNDNNELSAFRAQIDAIDDQLIHLLIERTGIVARVGEYKRKSAPGQCPIRPGREAEQIRRILKRFENTPLHPAAAALWRIIIGASTAVEAPLGLSVYTPERDNDLYWLAREYFGSFLPVNRHQHIKRVIGDVMDGKAAVGIVPMLRSVDSTYWWTNLLQQGSDMPKIFARIPFVISHQDKDNSMGLAIARLVPEASGDDHSYLVLEADHNVSQHRLQMAFSNAKLEVTWINIATLNHQTRHHLVDVKGFIMPGHADLKAMLALLGPSIINISFLGAYALPIILENKSGNILESKTGIHVPTITKL